MPAIAHRLLVYNLKTSRATLEEKDAGQAPVVGVSVAATVRSLSDRGSLYIIRLVISTEPLALLIRKYSTAAGSLQGIALQIQIWSWVEMHTQPINT